MVLPAKTPTLAHADARSLAGLRACGRATGQRPAANLPGSASQSAHAPQCDDEPFVPAYRCGAAPASYRIPS